MVFLKRNISYVLASLLLLGTKVMASDNDCSTLKDVMQYLNDDLNNSFNVDKCCEFNGVVCNNNKEVTGLRFNNIPKIPDARKALDNISLLKNLSFLDLADNKMGGLFPQQVCSMTNLKSLNLANNTFTGTVPYSCKDLQNLEQINLEGNDLTGYLPYYPNLKGCSYKTSGLCNVVNAHCKSSAHDCTEEDIKNTNSQNGNPDSNSVTYEGASTSRDLNVNYGNGYGSDYGEYGFGSNGNDYGYGGYDYNDYSSGGYGNSYSSYGYGNGYTGYYNSYSSPFSSLFSILLYCILFALAIFLCCTCCCCGSCTSSGATATKPYATANKPTHAAYSTKPPQYTTTTTTTKPTTIKIDNEPNPYIINNGASADITNNTPAPYGPSGAYPPNPNVYNNQNGMYNQNNGAYPKPPQMGYGYGNHRGVEEETKIKKEDIEN